MTGHCRDTVGTLSEFLYLSHSGCIIKPGCVVCALYALCAGATAHRHYNCKKSKSRSGTVNDNKTVYISLEALALSGVSTSERQFHNKNKVYFWPSLIPT